MLFTGTCLLDEGNSEMTQFSLCQKKLDPYDSLVPTETVIHRPRLVSKVYGSTMSDALDNGRLAIDCHYCDDNHSCEIIPQNEDSNCVQYDVIRRKKID
jgi:hypothetical protein